MLKETTHPLAFVEPCYTVDRECAFWSCDFAHLFAFKKNKKCDVELTDWGYGGRLGEQNCEYDTKSM